MKIKSFFILTFAAIAALSFSCTKDDAGAANNDNTTATGFLSISLSSPATRTTGSNTEDMVIVNDSKINSLTILFVGVTGDADAGKIKYIYPNASYTPGSVPNSANAFRVATGNYEVYAVVNPTGVVAANIAVGNPIQAVLTTVNATDVQGFASGTSGFVMMNENNDVNGTGGVLCSITDANTVNNPAKAAIKVDRVVAALRLASATPVVQFSQNTSDVTPAPIAATVEVAGFVPFYARKNFNTIQKWETLNSATVLTVPSTEAFYNSISDILFYETIGTQQIPVTTGIVASDFKDLDFVLENRSEIIDVPSGGGITTYNLGTTAVIFKVIAKNTAGDAETFYKIVQTGEYYYDLTAAIERFNFLNPSDQISTSTTDSVELRRAGIRVFENGEMYYTYYIKDNNYSYYAVHRNAVYSMNLNNLFTIGSDLPAGEIDDPENPQPILHTFISVSVDVNPWVLDTHDIDL